MPLKPRVAAGQRDRLVTIQQLTDGVAGSGMPIETWTPLGDSYMSRLDTLADERFRAGQEGAWTETTWHLPYRADMDPELVNVPKTRRLLYSGVIHNIRAASVFDGRRGIELVTLAGEALPT